MAIFWIAQIIAVVAFCFDLASFQFKQRGHIIVCLCISASLISAHFFILGYATAGWIVLLSAFRFAVSYFTTSQWMMSLFLLVLILITYLTYEGVLSLIALISSVFIIVANFQRNDRFLRLIAMPGTFLWIIHNILARTPAMVFVETFFLMSNIVGYWRYYIHKKK